MATVVREIINTIMWKDDDKSRNAAEKKVNKFLSNLKNVGLAVGAAIVGIGISAIKAASDAEETLNKFNVVFGDIQDEANKTAKTIADGFGLSQTKSKEFLSGIGDLLTGLGMTQEESLKLAKQATELGVDIASFTNLSGGAEQAVQALTKGMLGEREMLKALGVSITETDLKDFAASQNLVWKEMDKASKAALTLNLVMKQSPNAIGDFARSSGSLANQLRILKAAWEDILVGSGSEILPEMRKIVGEIIVLVKTSLTPLIQSLVKSFLPLASAISNLLQPVFKLLIPAFKILQTILSNISKVIVNSLLPLLNFLIATFTPILEDINDIFTEIIESVTPLLEILLKNFSILLKQNIAPLLIQLKFILAILAPILRLVNLILSPILKVMNKILGVVNNLIDRFTFLFFELVNNISDNIQQAVSDFLYYFDKGFRDLKYKILDIVSWIKNKFKSIGAFITNIFSNVVVWLEEKFPKVFEFVSNIVQKISDIITFITDKIDWIIQQAGKLPFFDKNKEENMKKDIKDNLQALKQISNNTNNNVTTNIDARGSTNPSETANAVRRAAATPFQYEILKMIQEYN